MVGKCRSKFSLLPEYPRFSQQIPNCVTTTKKAASFALITWHGHHLRASGILVNGQPRGHLCHWNDFGWLAISDVKIATEAIAHESRWVADVQKYGFPWWTVTEYHNKYAPRADAPVAWGIQHSDPPWLKHWSICLVLEMHLEPVYITIIPNITANINKHIDKRINKHRNKHIKH